MRLKNEKVYNKHASWRVKTKRASFFRYSASSKWCRRGKQLQILSASQAIAGNQQTRTRALLTIRLDVPRNFGTRSDHIRTAERMEGKPYRNYVRWKLGNSGYMVIINYPIQDTTLDTGCLTGQRLPLLPIPSWE